ncbi:MAG: DPP IV N-terminal domain-containing protein, partial [Bacteroidota bacterium]
MGRPLVVLLVCIGFWTTVLAQKTISIEEIYSGTFRTQGLDVLRSLNNGEQYTVLNFHRSDQSTSIDSYDYSTLQKAETIVSSSELPEIRNFTSYTFSKDESKILLATQLEPIFRRSTLGIFYVYDRGTQNLVRIAKAKIQEPTMSPDGSKVAYVLENNLFLFDIASGTTKQITKDGTKNAIINGVTDWVYEEEFAFVRAFDWNSDGSKIAFLRFDETHVPEFSMDVYGTDLYPSPHVFKYPKAGEENAVVTLHLLDVKSGSVEKVDLGEAYYIPRLQWMNDPDRLSVQTLNRHQNNLQLILVNARDNRASLLMEETDKAYVEVTDYLTFLENDSFVWTSERDGYNHLYLYGPDGKLKNQITSGDWEVTDFYGYDEKQDRLYYQSTENGSINRGVYSIDKKGKKKRNLSVTEGTSNADFSANFSYFINTYSSAKEPYRYTLHEASSGKKIKDIKD